MVLEFLGRAIRQEKGEKKKKKKGQPDFKGKSKLIFIYRGHDFFNM